MLTLDHDLGYYGIKNMPDTISSEDIAVCEAELKSVFSAYHYDHPDFDAMVTLFAEDPFYKCHYIAQIYLSKKD